MNIWCFLWKLCNFAEKIKNMANEIEKLKIELLDPELVTLADKIVQVIEEGKQALAVSINEIIKTTYWRIGQYIVEFEQQGNAKAKYGTSLLSNLAKLLRARVGRGYSHPNLNNMRKFYLMYPNFQISDKSSPIFQTSEKSDSTFKTVSDKLTWSHICELVTIDDQLEREFYEKECISEGWTVNELHRQKESGLFMRLAVSKDKQGVLTLAHEGQQVQTPEDVVKNTYTLEFLGIEPENASWRKVLAFKSDVPAINSNHQTNYYNYIVQLGRKPEDYPLLNSLFERKKDQWKDVGELEGLKYFMCIGDAWEQPCCLVQLLIETDNGILYVSAPRNPKFDEKEKRDLDFRCPLCDHYRDIDGVVIF